jgi:hypothetical protein
MQTQMTEINKTLNALQVLVSQFGDDASLRQIIALLRVAQAGPDGVDSTTLQRRMEASQAGVSRTLKLLTVTHDLTEFFLTKDGAHRAARLQPKGAALVKRFLKALYAQ